jgi:hypothetical protein
MTFGFDQNMNKQGNTTSIPTNTMKETGLSASTFASSASQYDHYHLINLTTTTTTTSTNTSNNKSITPITLNPEERTRVRVFGYDKSNIEAVIRYFTNIGDLEPSDCISEGNWMTFNYKTHEAALKAIDCNGMNIDKDYFVGVTWYEKAQEMESSIGNQEKDLFQKSTGFMNVFSNGGVNNQIEQKKLQQHQQETKQHNLLDTLREKLLGW